MRILIGGPTRISVRICSCSFLRGSEGNHPLREIATDDSIRIQVERYSRTDEIFLLVSPLIPCLPTLDRDTLSRKGRERMERKRRRGRGKDSFDFLSARTRGRLKANRNGTGDVSFPRE